MTQSTPIHQEVPVKNIIVTTSLGEQPELLAPALAVAMEFARQAGASLALNMQPSLRSQLQSLFTADAAERLLKGETVTADAAPPLSLIGDQEVEHFNGLIFFIGVDAPRLQLLKTDRTGMVIAVPQSNAELTELLSSFPSAGRLRLEPGKSSSAMLDQHEMTPTHLSKVAWLEERYDMLASRVFSHTSPEIILDDGEPGVCRYCGKSSPEVSFESISHAFPEQIGNKSLLDSLECDSCNAHFANAVDHQFGLWSLLERALAAIPGKKKPPTFTGSKRLGIDASSGIPKITVRENDPRIKFDHEAKRIDMLLERRPYIPMGVFKCFVKMALAVMPAAEATKCNHLKTWILEKEHTSESSPVRPLVVHTQIVSGPVPKDKICFMLVRRKVDAVGCPYMMFMVQFGNHIHQIVLPMPAEDSQGKGVATFTLSHFPHPWETMEHVTKYGSAKLIEEDLSSPEIKRNDPYPMRFSFEEAIETTPPKEK